MRFAAKPSRALAVLLALGCAAACSSVRATYRQAGYDARAKDAIKRVAVVGWAPQNEADLGPVLAHVAADLIKLRKNYLVTGASAGYAGRWSMACADGVQGVAMVRALEVARAGGGRVQMTLALELLRCSDGALLFREEASGSRSFDDAHLRGLTQNYTALLGEDARHFAAPSFGLLQPMVAALPDPVLDDAEVEEKIELGAVVAPGAPGAPAHCAG